MHIKILNGNNFFLKKTGTTSIRIIRFRVPHVRLSTHKLHNVLIFKSCNTKYLSQILNTDFNIEIVVLC